MDKIVIINFFINNKRTVASAFLAFLIVVLFISLSPIIFPTKHIDTNNIVSVTTPPVQLSQNIVAGKTQSIKWIQSINTTNPNQTKKYLKVPNTASKVKLTTFKTKEELDSYVKNQQLASLTSKNQLTLNDRQDLAGIYQGNLFYAIFKQLSYFSKYWKADAEEAIQNVQDSINPPEGTVPTIDTDQGTVVEIPTPADQPVVVEYETPAPTITEQETETGKIVTVSIPDEPTTLTTVITAPSGSDDVTTATPGVGVPLTLGVETPVPVVDVVAHTTIPEIYKVGQEDKIKLKWKSNGDQAVTFTAFDLNNNGKLDYVEWTVPHLSDQIFEIIFISKAFELDRNKDIVNDVYDQVQTKDNNWASIPAGHYIRVTFEQVLDSSKDITIYARPTNPNTPATIEVYEKDTNNLIATFPEISAEGQYQIFLSNLATPSDQFDLKVIGDLDIDYIVDPTLGVDWTALTPGTDTGIKFGTNGAYSVAYGNGVWVAIGQGGYASYSTDGINWTALPHATNASDGIKFGNKVAISIAYGNDKFVVVGQTGYASYSTDGINWTALPHAYNESDGIKFGSSINALSVAYGNNTWVVVGMSGYASYSSDGISWTKLPTGTGTGIKFGTKAVYFVLYGGDKFVAVGQSGYASYSVDGISWTALSHTADASDGIKCGSLNIAQALAYGNATWVVAGENGFASYSADGINWTSLLAGDTTGIKFGTTWPVQSLAYCIDKFMAVGYQYSSYSSDGISWTALPHSADGSDGIKFGAAYAYSVAYGNNTFVAVGDSGKASYSSVPADTTPPAPSNFSPKNNSAVTSSTPTITFTTDENATCKSSLTDQAYGDMTGDACTGGGTTSQSCVTPDLGADGAKNVYIACTDGTNADTADTNENLSYYKITTTGTARYWIATSSGNWNDTANWSTTSGGTGGSSVPTSTYDAIFDGNGNGNCAVNATASAKGFYLAGYTGTVTQSSGIIITIGADGFNQSSGTFTGADGGTTLNGAFTLAGGTFNAGSQTITDNVQNWTKTGGTFSAGTSTVVFDANSGSSLTITGSQTFNKLTFKNSTSNGTINIAAGSTLTVTGTLTFGPIVTTSRGLNINTGAIEAQGDITIIDGNGSSFSGTATLLINGTSDQTLAVGDSPSNGASHLLPVTINKTGGTLFLSGPIATLNNWTYIAGTVDAGTSTVIFNQLDFGTLTITGSQTFNNLTFQILDSSAGFNIDASSTITVTGTLTFGPVITLSRSLTINSGTIEAKGNISVVDTNGSFYTGTTVLNIKGTADQQLSCSGSNSSFQFNPITINKPSGTVSLATNASFNTAGQDLTITSGTLDLNGKTLTVNDQFTIGANGTLAMTGDETVNKQPTSITAGGIIEYNRATGSHNILDWTYTNAILKISSLGTTIVNASKTVAGFILGPGAVAKITSGQTLTVNGNFTSTATTGSHATLSAVTSGSKANMPVSGTATANYVEGTDIDSTGGTEINNATGGATTNCTNWHNFNTAPTLTSISKSPSPIKGGSTITITPSGQADADSNSLNFYCNETGSPTSSNTLCTQANASYSSPYTGMTCSYSVTTGDATRTIYCRVYDGTDYSTERTTTYVVDTTAPTITITNPNTNPAQSKTITATGGDGTITMSNTTGSTCNGTLTFTTYASQTFTLESDNGTKVCYKSTDTVGNISYSLSDAISGIDVTNPTTTDDYTLKDNVWQNTNQTITLTPADAGSGVSWTKYCLTQNCDPTTDGVSYDSNDKPTITAVGTSYFNYASQDNAGNTQTTVSRIIKIDKTAPTTTASAGTYTFGQTSTTSVNVTLTCSDGTGSGCSTTLYCISQTAGCTNFALATSVAVTSDGTWYLRYYSLDASNNAESSINENTIKILTPVAETKTSTSTPAAGGGAILLTQNSQTQNQPKNIIEQITQQITQQITNLTHPIPATQIQIPETTPTALQGWDVMEVKPINELSLTPVNSSISFFADKIPQFKQALTALGIDVENISDVKKVSGVEMYLPGLTKSVLTQSEILATNTAEFDINKFALVQGVPLADLSADAKQKIPNDIVFVRSGGELIDYSVAISVDKKGNVEQKLNTIAGKPMELVIKPDQPAKSVTGLMTLKKVSVGQKNTNILGYITKFLTASLVDSTNQNAEVPTENALLVKKFAYAQVSPGIYKASVDAPQAEGEYEMSTVIAYQDINLAPKETKMAVIVNPEGYVYSQQTDGRLRVKGASVSLYWLNPDTKKYELWPAEKFLQKNPISTDETGKYSFLVPQGTYKIKATVLNYSVFESDPFTMKEDIVVNKDIELLKKATWFSWLNWQNIVVALLSVIIVLLGVLISKGRKKYKINN